MAVRQPFDQRPCPARDSLNNGGMADRYDPVPDKFRSMVRFGVPLPQPRPKEGEPVQPVTPTSLAAYVAKAQNEIQRRESDWWQKQLGSDTEIPAA